MSKARKEMKIEREKKFKKEYISVIFSGIIVIALLVMMCALVMYDEQETADDDTTIEYGNLEDLTIDNVSETCDEDTYDKLVSNANKFGVTYYAKNEYQDLTEEDKEWYEGNEEDLEYEQKVIYEIEIKMTGLEEGFTLKVSNDFNDNKLELTSKDFKDGIYTFLSEDISTNITYTIEIIANDGTCSGQTIRKTSFTTKVYNIYYNWIACVMYPKFKYCSQLVDEEISYSDFETAYMKYEKEHEAYKEQAQENLVIAVENSEIKKEEVKAQKEGKTSDSETTKNKNKTNKILERIKEEKVTIIVGLSVIAVGVCSLIIFAKIRSRRL